MMMGGMMVIWLIVLIVIAVRVVGPMLAGRGGLSALPPERERTPEELARERYARGEISAPEYEEMLVNLLKDRYVQGDLDLAEYEKRASHVLDEAVLVPASSSARLKAPTASDRLMPIGDGPALSGGRADESYVTRQSASPEVSAESGHRREARADLPLDALRQRFLSGELTYQEYEEQRKRLVTA